MVPTPLRSRELPMNTAQMLLWYLKPTGKVRRLGNWVPCEVGCVHNKGSRLNPTVMYSRTWTEYDNLQQQAQWLAKKPRNSTPRLRPRKAGHSWCCCWSAPLKLLNDPQTLTLRNTRSKQTNRMHQNCKPSASTSQAHSSMMMSKHTTNTLAKAE